MLCAMTRTSTSAGGAPPPLTLLIGAEPFLVSRAIGRVVRAARAVDPQVERREVDASDPAAVGALQSALSPSLFGESAVVVVADLADAPDAVVDALLAGLADLADRTWVVVQHAGTRSRKTLDLVRSVVLPDPVAEVSCAEVKRGRPTRELLESEARAAGRLLTSDGAEALVMALGPDIALLVGALEQLTADNPEGPIDSAAVTTTFAGVAEVSGFQLADAVWEGRALLALQRLRWGLSSQTVTGAGAVGSLAAGLRAMVRVAGAGRGMAEADVARVAGVPPFKVRALRQTVSSWQPRQLADAVVRLAAVDAQVKGGLRPGESLEAAQKAHAIERYVIETAGLGERRSPANRPPPSRGR